MTLTYFLSILSLLLRSLHVRLAILIGLGWAMIDFDSLSDHLHQMLGLCFQKCLCVETSSVVGGLELKFVTGREFRARETPVDALADTQGPKVGPVP